MTLLQHRHLDQAVVEVPDGDPPTDLETTDIVEGDGAEAKAGDQVTVDYVGVSQSDGRSSTPPGIAASPSRSSSAPAR